MTSPPPESSDLSEIPVGDLPETALGLPSITSSGAPSPTLPRGPSAATTEIRLRTVRGEISSQLSTLTTFFFIRSSRAYNIDRFLLGKKHGPFMVILGVRPRHSLYFLAFFWILGPFFAVLRCSKTCISDVLPRRADFLKFVCVK